MFTYCYYTNIVLGQWRNQDGQIMGKDLNKNKKKKKGRHLFLYTCPLILHNLQKKITYIFI